MLKDLDLTKYSKVFIATGYTDMRAGMTGLVNLIKYKYGLDFYNKNSIFLFCGKKANTIKAVTFEGDGIVLLTKRAINGRFQWPRSREEARMLTPAQFHMLMAGFSIDSTMPSHENAAV